MKSLGEPNDMNNINDMISNMNNLNMNNPNNMLSNNNNNNNNNNNSNLASSGGLRERSAQLNTSNNNEFYDVNHPFSDGFLICTQLVKTGGADQGGLQVGDVFVNFGHYSRKNFRGLKSIAALVRSSAKRPINCVVWRKLETTDNNNNGNNGNNGNGNGNDENNNNGNENDKNDNSGGKDSNTVKNNKEVDDNGVKTVYQKLELKLTPLQSHDADGGGVLGSVINTWPLPEMKS